MESGRNNQDSEQQQQQLKELNEENERMKIKHEKQISELNNELDRLRANGKFSVWKFRVDQVVEKEIGHGVEERDRISEE